MSGKNIWGGEKFADDIISIVPNASKDSTNKTITFAAGNVTGKVLFKGAFKEGTQYTVIVKQAPSSNSINMAIVHTDGTTGYFNNNGMAVSVSGKTVEAIKGIWSSGNSVLEYEDCGVFEGVLTADQFEPYNGTSYTTDLGQTVYGGTLDVVSGVLTVDRAMVTLDGVTSGKRFSGVWGATNNGYAVYWSADIPRDNSAVSDRFVVSRNGYDSMPLGSFVGDNGVNTTWTFILPSSITSKDEANAWLAENPTTIAYHLATPQTIQLTPQEVELLKGQNNLWCDSGNIQVNYYADIQKYIDKKLS